MISVKELVDNETFKEVYFLYELSLTVGQSLDLKENIKDFLNNLVYKKKLDFATVWIKNKWLLKTDQLGHASLFHTIPKARTDTTSIALDHPIFHHIYDANNGLIIHEKDPRFKSVICEKGVVGGVFGIFPLANLGFLKFYSSDKNAFDQGDLYKLAGVVNKFAVSIKASIAYQSALENEKKISKIISNSLDAVVIINEKGCVTHWNTKSEKIFGWTRSEILYQKMDSFIVPEIHRQAHNEGMENYFKTKTGAALNQRIEITALRKSGEEFDIELSIIPIELSNTTIFGAFIRDITEAKRAKEALIEARKAAEASAEAKEMFLANISHEFRTPLNAIQGMGELLERTDLTMQQKKYIKAIQTSSNNLTVIVNDILNVAKITSGHLQVEKIGFNLEELIENTIESLYPIARSKGLVLNFDVDKSIAPVLIGDPVRLSQIFVNLLNNAIKFTLEGQVVLRAYIKGNSQDYNEVFFEIIDTGIGIDESKIDKIFDDFVQEDGSISRRFGGTGLGLSIVKKLVDKAGGTISVKSKKGEGTTFSFVLKFDIGKEEDLPQNDYSTEPIKELENLNVLLAEDNELNQMRAAHLLEYLNMNVVIANNGIEAVDKIQEQKIDLILMDMQMPEMDGLEATKIIREKHDKNVPIIALTANSVEGDKQKCRDAGMNDFLSKPFKGAELIRIIKKLIAKKEEKIVEKKEEPKKICAYATGPLYSLEKVEQEAFGNASFVQKMIKLYIKVIPKSVDELVEHSNNKNWKRVNSVAHKLKPSFDLLSVTAITNTIREIESNAKEEKNLDQIHTKVKQVEMVVKMLIPKLEEELV